MPTNARSTRPTCPACGFAVFNRRCATCEKCHAALPASIAYTASEIAGLQKKEQVEEEARARRSAKGRAAAAQRAVGSRSPGLVDAVGLGLDIADTLDGGGD